MIFGILIGIELIIFVAIRIIKFRFDFPRNIDTYNLLRAVILMIVFSINSYLLFDKATGAITFIIAMISYSTVLYLNELEEEKIIRDVFVVVLIPVFALTIVIAGNFALVDLSSMLLPMLILNMVMHGNFSFEIKWKRMISSSIGIVIGFVILWSNNESVFTDFSYQESIGYNFLKSELGYEVDYINAENTLHGEECEIVAFVDKEDIMINMLYHDNEIIKYEVTQK